MCLIVFAVDARADLPLVVAANRDERYARPTAPAGRWPDAPHVLGGRDLQEGGSWLGVTTSGRWAAVTNFRESSPPRPNAPSRGDLVADYLRRSDPPQAFTSRLAETADRYNGFNLLVGVRSTVRWFSNRGGDHPLHDVELSPGVYGLSNHLLDSPWPKVELGRRDLSRALHRGADPDEILQGLLDRTLAAEADLPRTGIPLELERALSARFITGTEYGTRSSTILRIDAGGRALLLERSFQPPDLTHVERFEFPLDAD